MRAATVQMARPRPCARPLPRVVGDVRTLQSLADDARAEGRRIALVPTMGALHDGHASLIAAARARADLVIVSIFVNPLQFGPNEDLSRYPRPFERDLAVCAESGGDVVFAPSPGEMVPPDAQTFVDVHALTQPLCGASRPGHFRGVTTIVTRLFLAAKPHVALFGEKDFQQLAVIRRMTRDLGFDVDVVGVPTVREADGLALSSRNVFLSREMRHEALALSRALDAAQALVAAGERQHDAVLACVREVLAHARHGRLDYAELRDPDSLEPAPSQLDRPTLLALAVRFPSTGSEPDATVRLIDNRVLVPGHNEEDVS